MSMEYLRYNLAEKNISIFFFILANLINIYIQIDNKMCLYPDKYFSIREIFPFA